MHSLWDDREAAEFVDRYGERWGEPLALRVCSSRLIGRDDTLVLHGGGNTSVKAAATDLLGNEREAIYVKGSGWDLVDIEPEGLPGLDLAYLRTLRALDELSDEAMVNELRTHLFDASSPNPSIETLLHAFVPHAFVDHSHANAILALTNQEEGEKLVNEALGDAVPLLPYVMPGFPLALQVAQAVEEHPRVPGVVLRHHGLFTWGRNARESYERHIELVGQAERLLDERGRKPLTVRIEADVDQASARATVIAPLLRGALTRLARSTHPASSFVLDWRADEALLGILGSEEARDLALAPPLTPDHTIRTKPAPCWIEPGATDRAGIEAALDDFAAGYRHYFERGVEEFGQRTVLDVAPRLVCVPGCGVFGVGADAKAAGIAADIAEHTLATKAASNELGKYQGLPDRDLFDIEYWSLEQAKLAKGGAPALRGKVAAVTGGAGAIGEAVGHALAAAGAEVALLDRDAEACEAAAARIVAAGGRASAHVADVTDPDVLDAAFGEIVLRYGGLDILVPNAGIAHVGAIVDLDPEAFRRVVDVNQTGVLHTLQAGGRVLLAQGTGGSGVLGSSKNVAGPGAHFAAYSASKAGAHQIGRVAALEWADAGIRVNMVCPDAVFGFGDNTSGLWDAVGPDRARSRGMDPSELPNFYMERSLLKQPVRAEDVGRAVLFFASPDQPITGAMLPVDAGVPGAFPR